MRSHTDPFVVSLRRTRSPVATARTPRRRRGSPVASAPGTARTPTAHRHSAAAPSAVFSASSLALTDRNRPRVSSVDAVASGQDRNRNPVGNPSAAASGGAYEPPARIAALESLVAGALQDFEAVAGEALRLPQATDDAFVPGGRPAPPRTTMDRGTWCEAADFAYSAPASHATSSVSGRPVLAQELQEAAAAARSTLSEARQRQEVSAEVVHVDDASGGTAAPRSEQSLPTRDQHAPAHQSQSTPVRGVAEVAGEAPEQQPGSPWDDTAEASRHLRRLHDRLIRLDDTAAALEARLEDSASSLLPEPDRLRALRGVREERSGFVDRKMLLDDARRLIAANQ